MKTAIDQKTILDVMNTHGDQFLEWEDAQLKKSIEQSLARHRATQQQPQEKAKKPTSLAASIFGQPPQQPGYQAQQAAYLAALGRGRR